VISTVTCPINEADQAAAILLTLAAEAAIGAVGAVCTVIHEEGYSYGISDERLRELG
jgi:predicted Zn-dependent protease with MMP-like domain